jgi:NADPH2:quinone reductase
MTNAIVLRETGGPEKLRLESIEVREPGPGELRIRHTAIGVNFHDVYIRSGLYKPSPLSLPGIPGIEAAGVVERVGSDVTAFAVGDRVCYAAATYGAYAHSRILPARLALAIPASVSDEAAASLPIKGLTTCMLLRHAHKVRPGETILIHAAAGGVGQFLVRWAKHLGATIIATAGSEDKAEIARQCGADDVILYRKESFVDRVKEITRGVGVDVVYDSVGADTFYGSMDCLGYCGTLVSFGQSSGAIEPLPVSQLAARSLSLVRPVVFHFIRERNALEEMAAETFRLVEAGILKAQVNLRFPLGQAGAAQAALESRATAGAIVLLP